MRIITFVLTSQILGLFSNYAISAPSPFDDLSSSEIKKTIEIIQGSGKFSSDIRYPVIRVQHPSKALWQENGAAGFRQSYAAIFDFKKSQMMELVIDLNKHKIVSEKELKNIKPPVLIEEYERARKLIRADERWINAMKKRGIQNLADVLVDIWAPGLLTKSESLPGQRLLRGVSYMKGAGKNFYSRPIEGVLVTVDLSKDKVVSVVDLENPPIASGIKEFDPKSQVKIDEALKPISTEAPKGVSYTLDGQEVSWGRWKFRFNMDPMQGLALSHIRFTDPLDNKERMILYKISLAEMLVPYGSPDATWTFRNAFDVGEYGLGKTAHPLELGADVPQHSTLIDTVLADDLGSEPVVIKGIALYERDGGILWKHRNAENGDTDLRRSRELIMTFMTTIGNYDYGINYIFKLDGTIKVDVQLTGSLLARGTTHAKNLCTGDCLQLVEKFILAPNHQHFFNFRLDFDIDGSSNDVLESNVRALAKGKNNPAGNIFISENTPIKTEKEGKRKMNPQSARKWKVVNLKSRNQLSHPRGYALMAEEQAVPYLHPSSSIYQRAQFISSPIWVTAYNENEMSGSHPYPTTADPGEGLPKYIKDNQSLENTDVVMWYTFGVTHVPRPEEWPIMNVHHTGFTLMPVNFFGENPGMVLAP